MKRYVVPAAMDVVPAARKTTSKNQTCGKGKSCACECPGCAERINECTCESDDDADVSGQDAACRGPVQDVDMMSAQQPVVAAAGKKGRGKRLRLLSSSEESSSEHEGEESPTGCAAPGLPRQESLGTKLKSLRQVMY